MREGGDMDSICVNVRERCSTSIFLSIRGTLLTNLAERSIFMLLVVLDCKFGAGRRTKCPVTGSMAVGCDETLQSTHFFVQFPPSYALK